MQTPPTHAALAIARNPYMLSATHAYRLACAAWPAQPQARTRYYLTMRAAQCNTAHVLAMRGMLGRRGGNATYPGTYTPYYVGA